MESDDGPQNRATARSMGSKGVARSMALAAIDGPGHAPTALDTADGSHRLLRCTPRGSETDGSLHRGLAGLKAAIVS